MNESNPVKLKCAQMHAGATNKLARAMEIQSLVDLLKDNSPPMMKGHHEPPLIACARIRLKSLLE